MYDIHPKFIIRFFAVFICIWIWYKVFPNYYALWRNRFDYSINTTMTFLSSNWLNKWYSKIKYDFKTGEVITFSWVAQEPSVVSLYNKYNAKNSFSPEKLMEIRKGVFSIDWWRSYVTKDKKYLIFLWNKINRTYGIPFEYGIDTINIVELSTNKWRQVDIPKNGEIIYDLTYITDISE